MKTKGTGVVIYDQRSNRIGFLCKDTLFGKYGVVFEEYIIYFRVHPKNWAKDVEEDRERYIVLGKLK